MNMQDVIEIRNGAKVKGTFSPQEMNRRLTSLRQVMKNKNLDAVILTSYHNVNYFSDYLYYSFGRPFALVVTQDCSVTVTTNIDGGLGYRRSFGENIIYTDWRRNNFYRAIKTILPQDKLRLGFEEDQLPLQSLNLLKTFYPGSEFFDVAMDLMFNRMIKSDEEIALIKNGARISCPFYSGCAGFVLSGLILKFIHHLDKRLIPPKARE
ncbi:aminopeptidase P family N-terminal domain-containing protein [Gallibacterium salpingitidis]|uniref:aminopeptidase P family N-terminal domain-containing protein n=1 Tax=Gallibacterium salpingitidis TaxID=505341 RepID=UPI0018D280E6|nr:aminopeptidase P family N-terminal domain-containing protein [Gallibacterium salpingitidis]WKS99412.1 aminopeptidase P family N-terminal domain-containing protein [Gallibacterium salpingitidis]